MANFVGVFARFNYRFVLGLFADYVPGGFFVHGAPLETRTSKN